MNQNEPTLQEMLQGSTILQAGTIEQPYSLPDRLRNMAKTTGLDAVVELLNEAANSLDCQQADMEQVERQAELLILALAAVTNLVLAVTAAGTMNPDIEEESALAEGSLEKALECAIAFMEKHAATFGYAGTQEDAATGHCITGTP